MEILHLTSGHQKLRVRIKSWSSLCGTSIKKASIMHSQLSTLLLFLLSFCTNLAFAVPNAQTRSVFRKRQEFQPGLGNKTVSDLSQAILQIGESCKYLGCPTRCIIIPRCNNTSLCNSDFAPPCCDPPDEPNEACRQQRDICARSGCNSLC